MQDQFARTLMQLGQVNMERLFAARVAVFGIGGVGGHCAEALARSGIGAIDLYDNDIVSITNLNRQIVATHKTLGMVKTDVMQSRILEINPNAKVGSFKVFYSPETADGIDLSGYDYIVDAVDTMTAKLELVCRASALGVPIICSMGAANKLDPSAFAVTDIYETSTCPMARIMRQELRKRNISKLKVVYSTESAIKPREEPSGEQDSGEAKHRRQVPSSNAFVPPVAGLILAGEVVKDLCESSIREL